MSSRGKKEENKNKKTKMDDMRTARWKEEKRCPHAKAINKIKKKKLLLLLSSSLLLLLLL